MNKKEGFIKIPNGKVWYKIVGEDKSVPLIVVHGGPGYPHDYLEPLEDLAVERQVVFYDQLGCGNSDKTTDSSLWTVSHFVVELKKIIEFLGLKKYHLLGQSWGAALAVAFALTKPQGLSGLVLADSYISTPEWEKDAKRLLQSLPKEIRLILEEADHKSEEYKQAKKEYYKRFVTRFDRVPEAMLRSNKKMNRDIYNYMWGPEEYLAIGTLKDFNQTDRLNEITTPTLLVCGRYDEATPETMEYYKSLFPDARVRVFEQSAHFPHWNEREEYMEVVKEFLAKHS